jgi:hypothetical protein
VADDKSTVWEISRLPICRIVGAAMPCSAVFCGEHLVGLSHPNSFYPAQLFDGPAVRCILAKAQGVHPANHSQTSSIVKRQRRLPQQLVRSCSTRLPGGIEPHTAFTYLCYQSACLGSDCNSSMTDPRAGLQHQTGDTAYRQVRAVAFSIDCDKGAVENVEPCTLHKDDRGALFQRDWARWRQAAEPFRA